VEFAAVRNLPPIMWTVNAGEPGAGLIGHCTGPRQLEDLDAWRAAVTSLIGPEHPDHGSGSRIFLYWADFMGTVLMLDAEKAEDAASSETLRQ
jgi:hypothetical protein